MKLVSRAEARALGLKRYCTGKSCPHGHTAVKFTSNGSCVECTVAWNKAHPESTRASTVRYVKAHPEKIRANVSRYYKKHPEKDRAKGAKRRALKRLQLCTCCIKEQFEAIYAAAQLTGYEVDHIVPLALGGMHCLRNLQTLSRKDHQVKTSRDHAAIWARRAAA
jgi:5-methylcytosine-specific restriction endonuclease McrA